VNSRGARVGEEYFEGMATRRTQRDTEGGEGILTARGGDLWEASLTLQRYDREEDGLQRKVLFIGKIRRSLYSLSERGGLFINRPMERKSHLASKEGPQGRK